MAVGLGGSYGKETQDDPSRQVDIHNLILNQAQALHKQGKFASDLKNIPDDEWASMHPGGMIPDKKLVGAHMRAYENYSVSDKQS